MGSNLRADGYQEVRFVVPRLQHCNIDFYKHMVLMDHFEEDLVAALRAIVKDGNWQCVGDTLNFEQTCTK